MYSAFRDDPFLLPYLFSCEKLGRVSCVDVYYGSTLSKYICWILSLCEYYLISPQKEKSIMSTQERIFIWFHVTTLTPKTFLIYSTYWQIHMHAYHPLTLFSARALVKLVGIGPFHSLYYLSFKAIRVAPFPKREWHHHRTEFVRDSSSTYVGRLLVCLCSLRLLYIVCYSTSKGRWFISNFKNKRILTRNYRMA